MIWKLNLFPGSQPAVCRKHGHGHRINTLLFSAARTDAEKRDKENGITHLYEIAPSGGEAVCRASVPAVITGIHLLPDGRYLLTIRHDNYKDTRKKSYEVFDELPFWGNGQGYTNAKRNRYAVYDLKSGDLTYVDDEWTDCSQYSVFRQSSAL